MQATPPQEWEEIQEIINQNILNQPRSRQQEIGPSELGTPCLHCLTSKIIGITTQQNKVASWRAYIGTSVHAQLEQLFNNLNNTRYQAETRVIVGNLTDTRPIIGSIDLWDASTESTIDWKIVANSTLTDAQKHGPSQQYRIQASLYGIGMSLKLGHNIQRSCIYYMPKNAATLTETYAYETPFDPKPGMWALNRARLILNLYETIKLEYGTKTATTWALAMPRNPQHCFHCQDQQQKTPTEFKDFTKTINEIRKEEHDQLIKQLPDMPIALLNVPQATYQPQEEKANQS